MKSSREIIEEFRDSPLFKKSIIYSKDIEEREPILRDFPAEVCPELKAAYGESGVSRLYSHQAETHRLVSEGRNVVVVTPTATGKTLCYNLPVIDAILKEPEKKALFLFPTKALSQDQQAEINRLSGKLSSPLHVFTFDGDTPRDIRNSAKIKGQIIISNPDMLHTAILPNHTTWVKFFENLHYIILDELHTYRGVFGSHVSGVLKRLLRIAKFYGVEPRFIASSATIANPKELAESLTGQEFSLVDQNGAPRGRKSFVLYNPPLVDVVQGIRRSSLKESVKVAEFFIKRKVKTIIFARSRINVELISTYLKKKFPHRTDIASYRGGYLPNERRKLERDIREGRINCIVSTNALELGIDIGGLDVSILCGYPGSIASTWQQSGRAGRKAKDSLSIFIANSSIIDQFFMSNPEFLFKKSSEEALVDPSNIFILLDQLKCASFEIPFKEDEMFIGKAAPYLEYLEENGVVHREKGSFYWSDRSFPAENISLRTATSGNFTIIDTTFGKNEVIGEIDRPSATELLFEEAIYIHQGKQYQVKKLDYEGRKAFIEVSNANYYTDAVSRYELEVLRELKDERLKQFERHHLEVLIRRITPKFKKIKYSTHENVGFGEIHLPEEEMHTTACALVFSDGFFGELSELDKENIILSFAHLFVQLVPLNILCDVRDIGYFAEVKSPFFHRPTIYLYDRYPGGTGLSDRIFANFAEIVLHTIGRVGECECEEGCLSCIGPFDIEKKRVKNYLDNLYAMLTAKYDRPQGE